MSASHDSPVKLATNVDSTPNFRRRSKLQCQKLSLSATDNNNENYINNIKTDF